MENLKELKEKIEKIKITYDYEETYCDLYNTCIKFENNTQSWEFDELFENIIDYETAEEITKIKLERNGLVRLYYFLNDVNLNNNIFKLNGYGNLEEIKFEDIEILKQEILDKIDELMQES